MWLFDFNSISSLSFWEEVLKISKYLKIPNNEFYKLQVEDYQNICEYINNLSTTNIEQQNILFMTKRFIELDGEIESNLKELAYESFYHNVLDYEAEKGNIFEKINFPKEEKILENIFWY